MLFLNKTGYVSQETRPNFIDSQHFYFHFDYMLFCIKVVNLSDKLSLMCPLLWLIEDICVGLYVLKRLFNARHFLEKVMLMQHSFEEFSEKPKRVKLKSVGNFVSKTVLVESANRFSLEELCMTQCSSLKYFRSHIDHHTLWKNLNRLSLNIRPFHCRDVF